MRTEDIYKELMLDSKWLLEGIKRYDHVHASDIPERRIRWVFRNVVTSEVIVLEREED